MVDTAFSRRQKDVSTLSVIGNDTSGWPRTSGARSPISGSIRVIMSSPGTRRSYRWSVNASVNSPTRIAAAKAGIADPAFQRVMAEIENLTSSYFATFDKIADCGHAQDAVFRDRAGTGVGTGCDPPHRNQGRDGCRRLHAGGVRRQRGEGALAAGTMMFADHLLTSGDSAAKASVDANIGEMREPPWPVGRRPEESATPQIPDRPHRGRQVVRRRFSGSAGFKPGSRPPA